MKKLGLLGVFIFLVATGVISVAEFSTYVSKMKLDIPSINLSQERSQNSSQSSSQESVVKRIVDGDTIELENGQKVRYIGMNTPETVKPNTKVQCFGKEASHKNEELVLGKKVRLEKDVSETDRYQRLLRYVYLIPQEGVEKELFVNDYLVREGYAQVSTFPPDVKFKDTFLESERYARDNNKGLWNECKK